MIANFRDTRIPGLIASAGINSDEISTIINVFFFFFFPLFFWWHSRNEWKKLVRLFFFTIHANINACHSIRIFLIIHLMERDDKPWCWYFENKIIKDLYLFISLFDLFVINNSKRSEFCLLCIFLRCEFLQWENFYRIFFAKVLLFTVSLTRRDTSKKIKFFKM